MGVTTYGNVKGSALAYSGGIGSGQLVADGTTEGRVCFVVDGQDGLHVVSWIPDFSSDPRAVWLFNLAE